MRYIIPGCRTKDLRERLGQSFFPAACWSKLLVHHCRGCCLLACQWPMSHKNWLAYVFSGLAWRGWNLVWWLARESQLFSTKELEWFCSAVQSDRLLGQYLPACIPVKLFHCPVFLPLGPIAKACHRPETFPRSYWDLEEVRRDRSGV